MERVAAFCIKASEHARTQTFTHIHIHIRAHARIHKQKCMADDGKQD